MSLDDGREYPWWYFVSAIVVLTILVSLGILFGKQDTRIETKLSSAITQDDSAIERVRATQAVTQEAKLGMLVVYRIHTGYERRKALTDDKVPIYTDHSHMFDNRMPYSTVLSKLSLKHKCGKNEIAVQAIYNNMER